MHCVATEVFSPLKRGSTQSDNVELVQQNRIITISISVSKFSVIEMVVDV